MNSGSRVKRITLSGILLAFTVISVFLAATLPTSKLSLYALSSLFMAVIIIEFGTRAGWAFYLASAILSVLLVPRLEVIPFIVFFGVYGLIKLYIERIPGRVIEYVLKLIYFNICLALGLFFLKEIILGGINLTAPVYIIAAVLELVFLLYDYIYTLFIRFYGSRLKQKLKI
ncbi:hypothetical protein [Ruminiclostridium cellobioparum]|jgi:hypothetical protein|uniref:Rod shape-determining protein MreD n=1 Tax=Ruminiclostridium cellobioparum subsp. termitidis CT1112 TaxID=1195236 RepID=S0FK48_RUMCE|nr:hypothetical protein [Ruminiclostridium cellobioparum]EMS72192.1 hypothetical protein CTER_1868 [Ruminiclostridium cellobioparum subsp. termitidis CT1112]